MAYCHTDAALSFYTGDQGVYRRDMDYPLFPEDRARLSSFQKSYIDAYAKREGTVEAVNWGVSPVTNTTYATGTTYWASYENGANAASTNAKAIFKNIWISADTWNSPAYRAVWENIY
jgi:hypothetical protein